MTDFDKELKPFAVCSCGVLVEPNSGIFAGCEPKCSDCAEEQRVKRRIAEKLCAYEDARKRAAEALKELTEFGHVPEDEIDTMEVEAYAAAYVRGRTLELPSDFKEAFVAGFEKAKEIYRG